MNATTQKLLDYHRDHLHASGLADATIEAAGFYSVSDASKMARLLNVKKLPKGLNPSALVFPFTDADGRNGYCRLRPDNPRKDASSGKAMKYESPRNEPNQVYLPPGVASHLANAEQEIAITEGEKKALACNQVGLPCIGLVGVYGWKEKSKETLLPALEHIAWKGRTVYIIFDSDASEKDQVREAMLRLSALSGRRSCPRGRATRGRILMCGEWRELAHESPKCRGSQQGWGAELRRRIGDGKSKQNSRLQRYFSREVAGKFASVGLPARTCLIRCRRG